MKDTQAPPVPSTTDLNAAMVTSGGALIERFVVEAHRYRWAERGIRYDDHCIGCRKTRDVDNAVDLCQRCYGEPREGSPY